MSFSDLRASRKTKSYVTGAPARKDAKEVLLEQSPSLPLYRDLPLITEIRTCDTSGRGLWSKANLRAGQVLFAVKPHVAVLSTEKLDGYCSTCFGVAPPSGLKRCTQCRSVWYCDSTCQTKDWSVHKHECTSLQRWSKAAPSDDLSIPSDAIRCMGRILWKKQRKGLDSVWTGELDSMQSHRKSLPLSTSELYAHLAHSLVQYLGLSSPDELRQFGINSSGDLVDLISRFTTNTFTITDAALCPLGASVSPTVALINHSCDPNAVIVFPRASANPQAEEPLMHVVVLRNIVPGEEIMTAYIDTTLPRSLRQEGLKETYHFDCRCQLCESHLDVDPRESMWCPKACGGMCPLPTEENPLTRCNECKSAVQSTDAVLDAVRVGQEALDKATAVQFKDPAKARQLTTKLIPILTSAGLTPSCHPLLGLTILHKSFLISSFPSPCTQEYLDDTIRVARKAITGLTSIHREGHPVLGIALAELAKILAVDEPSPRETNGPGIYPPSGPPRLKLALDTFMRARNSLMIGFGMVNEGGEIGRHVREVLVSLEKEIGVWKQGVRNVLQDTPKLK
ncbi:SET domain-containing protein [Armillaria gallica]|uniref:SET domain-containing protein n=1 Tax=Armillaria gallica TaxID=47427 RepID=A0A2H3DL54_ARMGA|nr:SET domain-containing protein [Armillaria gallica]